MPTYRVLAGHGTVVDSFEASNNVAAVRLARELTKGFRHRVNFRFGDRPDLRVESEEREYWRCIYAWVPGT